MGRLFGWLFGWLLGFPLAVIAVVFAISNRAPVVADLWPLPWAIEAPLYLFVLVALVIGFLIGGAVAWAGSLATRRRVRAETRVEIQSIRREAETSRTRVADPAPGPAPGATLQLRGETISTF